MSFQRLTDAQIHGGRLVVAKPRPSMYVDCTLVGVAVEIPPENVPDEPPFRRCELVGCTLNNEPLPEAGGWDRVFGASRIVTATEV